MDKRVTARLFNRHQYAQRRQELRRDMTAPEHRLWQQLRNRQMGVKFRRQHGVGSYIADFYCPELKMIVEIDGDSHFTATAQKYDEARDAFMATLNILTIRINNDEVSNNIEGVCAYLEQQIHIRTKDLTAIS